MFGNFCAFLNHLDREQVRETKINRKAATSSQMLRHSVPHVFPGKDRCSWEPCTF